MSVFYALMDIEARLPFKIRGYDSDNGGEVLNWQILSYFTKECEEKKIRAQIVVSFLPLSPID